VTRVEPGSLRFAQFGITIGSTYVYSVVNKPDRQPWRFLPPAQLAAHLIAVPQICDAAWTREPRLPGESRADFVARVTGVPA
jgi:hypothetical protein